MPNTDTDHLATALALFTKAQTELMQINLRHYRGHVDIRTAVQEARNSADCGVDWTAEALQLGQPLSQTA